MPGEKGSDKVARSCQKCGAAFWINRRTLAKARSQYTGMYCPSCRSTVAWSSRRRPKGRERYCRLCGARLPINHRLICRECQQKGGD